MVYGDGLGLWGLWEWFMGQGFKQEKTTFTPAVAHPPRVVVDTLPADE